MHVSQERIMERIEALARFNATPGAGVTRFSFGPEDAQARDYLFSLFRQLDMAVKVDPVGNIRARYPGQDSSLAPVWVGSHIDSVLLTGISSSCTKLFTVTPISISPVSE